MFRELAEKPWVQRWWSQVLGLMHRLSVMLMQQVTLALLLPLSAQRGGLVHLGGACPGPGQS